MSRNVRDALIVFAATLASLFLFDLFHWSLTLRIAATPFVAFTVWNLLLLLRPIPDPIVTASFGLTNAVVGSRAVARSNLWTCAWYWAMLFGLMFAPTPFAYLFVFSFVAHITYVGVKLHRWRKQLKQHIVDAEDMLRHIQNSQRAWRN